MSAHGWIGVDLDGTLAHYDQWRGTAHIGEPIVPMVERVKAWVQEGCTVKVFTARVGYGDECVIPIQAWCQRHIGMALEVTATKDFRMVELWDDRAVQVITNTGLRADGITA